MTYTRHSVYRQSSATAWTRIDMLLALYDAVIVAVERGGQAINARDEASLIQHRFRAQTLIAELISGVDPEQGEIPTNVIRLLAFSLDQISDRTREAWESALRILSHLRSSFRAIRDEAAQLEQAGEIPAIPLGIPEMTLAVG